MLCCTAEGKVGGGRLLATMEHCSLLSVGHAAATCIVWWVGGSTCSSPSL